MPLDASSILHVVAPAAAGGLETVVSLLAEGHARRGARVSVATVLDESMAEPPALAALRAAGVRIETIRLRARAYLEERAAVAALCRTVRPRIMHTHGYRPDVVDAGVAQGLGIPTVSTVHGWTNSGWRGRAYEYLQRAALRRFHAVVSVSRPIFEDLASFGVPADRLHLVRNAYAAAGCAVARGEARRRLNVPSDGFRVGWVGRATREKGLDVLVRASATLGDGPIAISVVGAGSELRSARSLAASLGVADRITWHGLLPEAGRLMSAFDVLVLSSRAEGTPMVLLEAMAAGTPIIATRVGGVPDVVDDATALLVPAEDAAGLANAIRQVQRSPGDALARAARARRRLDEHFSLEPWLDRYADLYEHVAGARAA